jgi:hypothetical protein
MQCILTYVVATLLLATTAAETRSLQILPLEQVWALDMSKTKDVHKFEPSVFGKQFSEQGVKQQQKLLTESMILQIKQALGEPEKFRLPSGKSPQLVAFAVPGRGREALEAIHRVLVKKEKPQSKFQKDSDITVCFFSLQAGTYVHLTSVELGAALCQVRYQFVPHLSTVMSEHFAMIPFTTKQKGKVTVNILLDKKKQNEQTSSTVVIPTDWGKKLIAKSFYFTVE